MISSFCSGTACLDRDGQTARVAKCKPDCRSRSAKITVCAARRRKDELISRLISFFFSGLFSSERQPAGRISESSAGPPWSRRE